MGIIRKTQAVALILDEFNKGSNAISAIELIKRLNKKINNANQLTHNAYFIFVLLEFLVD